MVYWETVKLPKNMIERIERILDSQYGKELGFTSKSQVVVASVREFFKQFTEFMTYLEIKDISKNIVILHDHKLGKDIKIKITTEKLFCSKDKHSCKHIDFVRMLPRFQNNKK